MVASTSPPPSSDQVLRTERRTRALFIALLVLTLAGVIGSGVLRRYWVDPSDQTEALAAAAERMQSLPSHFGEWDGKEVEHDSFDDLPAAVYGTMTSRRYLHRSKGSSVGFFIAFGKPGPLCVHDPMLCVAEGRGVTVVSGPTRITNGDADKANEIYVATFTRNTGIGSEHFRIFWSFSGDGRWRAPDNPRVALARERWLYKVYVSRNLQRPDEPLEGDPAGEFIQSALPKFNAVLFPSS